MLDEVPGWLASALPRARACHARLAVARLGREGMIGRGGFALASAAFDDGGALDPSFTADEEDAVAPPIEWTLAPSGTHELALVVEDPEGAAGGEPFCHWLVWGLQPGKGQILEGETPPRTGKNSHGNSEWLLPDAPTADEPHEYVFQLFALDLPLTLAPGATRGELLEAMEGHVLSVALLTATYAGEEGLLDDLESEAED